MKCKVCGGVTGHTFDLREMMLGLRTVFKYELCDHCQTIQIMDVPESIGSYYPGYYYSFTAETVKLKPVPFIKRLLGELRMKKKYRKAKEGILAYLKPLTIFPHHKILDIGCGKGKLICEMFNMGFRNVKGVDKFIDREYDHGYGVKVLKRDLGGLEANEYDLLMMHHVFEHMAEPLEELRKCHVLLKKDGHLMIRIPVVAKAWEIYGKDWVQLDAPRHFFLYSERSMRMIAAQAGFVVTEVVYDSTGFQFWGSELYKKDIALLDPESRKYLTGKEFFSDQELQDFELSARALNSAGEGDQAIFYLRKR